MLSSLRGRFIPTRRHQPFIAAVTVVTNGNKLGRIIHRSNNRSVGKNIPKQCRFYRYTSVSNDVTTATTLPVVTAAAASAEEEETSEATEMDDTSTSLDVLLARQKERAIDYWETSKAKSQEDLKDQVHDDVLKHLEEGKVLPIFHTLCCPPEKRLFEPEQRVSVRDDNSEIIQLSAAPVTAGVCIREEGNATVGKISSRREASYISAFFKKDIGIYEVKDVGFNWEYDEDYTKIIADLVNAPAEMAGEDIEVTKLLEPLEVDQNSGRKLITRRLSRGVVADCFDKSESGSTYAITGNPGIGKSWTLIYALQQALLYENACVLLCFQKEGKALVCVRRNNKIYAWMNDDSLWETGCRSRLFENSNVLALLDPRESKNGGAEFSAGRRMMAIFASSNSNHFGGLEKFTPFFARYLSPYTNGELRVAAPLIVKDPKSSPFLERAKEVGNLPRYIFSDLQFESRKKQTIKSISMLKESEVNAILFADGTAKENYENLHGCIFAVEVSLILKNKTEGDEFSNENQDSDNQLDETRTDDTENIDDDNDTTITDVGYDGQLVPNYGKFSIRISSESVLDQIVNLSRGHILSFWGVTSSGRRSEMGRIVENLFWQDLRKGYKMRVFSMKEKNASVLDFENCDTNEDTVKMNELGHNVFDAKKSAKKSDCFIVRMAEGTAFCDFVKRHRCASTGQYKLSAFQVTVSDQHSISKQGLEELLIFSGHICKAGDTIEKSENADDIKKVSLYWVVPPSRLEYWKRKAPKKFQKTTSELLKECLEKYVEQHVLPIDVVPNQVRSVSGQDDVEDQGPQTVITRASMKAQCASIGVQSRGTIETLQKRLKLVEYKEPDKVDTPTKEKLDAYTAPALRLLCDALGLSIKGKKYEVIQRLVDYATSKSLNNFASMLDDNVKIDYNPTQ